MTSKASRPGAEVASLQRGVEAQLLAAGTQWLGLAPSSAGRLAGGSPSELPSWTRLDTHQLATELARSPLWRQALLVAKGADGRTELWRALRDHAGVHLAPLGSPAAKGLERLAQVRSDLHVLGLRVAPTGVQLRVLDGGMGPAHSTERAGDSRLAPGELIDIDALIGPTAAATTPRLVVHDRGAPLTQPRQARLDPEHPATIETIDALRRRLSGAALPDAHWLVREAGLPAGALLTGVRVGGRAERHQDGPLAAVDAARAAAMTQGDPVDVELVTEHGFERRRLQLSADGRTHEDEPSRRVDVALSSASREAPEIESLLRAGAPYGFRVARAVAWAAGGERLTDDAGSDEVAGEPAMSAGDSSEAAPQLPPPGVELEDFEAYLEEREEAFPIEGEEEEEVEEGEDVVVDPAVEAQKAWRPERTRRLSSLVQAICDRVAQLHGASGDAASEAILVGLANDFYVGEGEIERASDPSFTRSEDSERRDLEQARLLIPLLQTLAAEARAEATHASRSVVERDLRIRALSGEADPGALRIDPASLQPAALQARLREADANLRVSETEGDPDSLGDGQNPDADDSSRVVDPARAEALLAARLLRFETAIDLLRRAADRGDLAQTGAAVESAVAAAYLEVTLAPAAERLAGLRVALAEISEALRKALTTPAAEGDRPVDDLVGWYASLVRGLLSGARTSEDVLKLLHVHRATEAQAAAAPRTEADASKSVLLTGRRFATLAELESFLAEAVPPGGTAQLFAPDGRTRLECTKVDTGASGAPSRPWLVSVFTKPPGEGSGEAAP